MGELVSVEKKEAEEDHSIVVMGINREEIPREFLLFLNFYGNKRHNGYPFFVYVNDD